MIVISISEQCLRHRRRTGVWHNYPISTARNGAGNENGSFQTPLGRHRICKKIGGGLPPLTAFVARTPVGMYHAESDTINRDWILTRILWLDGTQTGLNRRGRVDTRARYIYIHATHEEDKLGTPVSHGCIRMGNADVLELFEHTQLGERVYIRP